MRICSFKSHYPNRRNLHGYQRLCAVLFTPVSPVSRWATRKGLDDDEFVTETGSVNGRLKAIRVGDRIPAQHLGQQLPATWHVDSGRGGGTLRTSRCYTTTRAPPSGIWVRYFRRLSSISAETSIRAERCVSFHAEDMITTHQVGVNREQCRKFYQVGAFALPDVQGKTDVLRRLSSAA